MGEIPVMSVPLEHLRNHRKLERSQSTTISIDDSMVKQKPFWEFREGRNFVCFCMIGFFWLLAMGFMFGRILFLPQELEQAEDEIVYNVMHNPHFVDRFGLNN